MEHLCIHLCEHCALTRTLCAHAQCSILQRELREQFVKLCTHGDASPIRVINAQNTNCFEDRKFLIHMQIVT